LCGPILNEAFVDINHCIGKPENSNLKELKGEMRIEKGYLFISKVEPKDESILTANDRKCLDSVIGKPRVDVANGLLYNPSLLSRDFVYEFHGEIYPEIAGQVKSVDYVEIRKF
jgi:hypothetical protein